MQNAIAAIIGLGVGALLISLRTYTGEKGKNLATKEDVAEITAKVEQVRTEYLVQLERAKAGFGEAQAINRTQYELELAAYRDVWDQLLPVHRAATALRPAFDTMPRDGETDEDRKRGRLKAFGDTFNPFSSVVWKHRPFYPAGVFAELEKLMRLMYAEATAYHVFDPYEQRDYWEKALASAKEINEQVDVVCDTIRTRLSVARVA